MSHGGRFREGAAIWLKILNKAAENGTEKDAENVNKYLKF